MAAMYHHYFGLHEAPFSIAVNPRYLFMSARHRDALAHLLYGVGAGGGFILLTGEVGTGKTTINRCLLEQLPQDTDIAIILNPALNAEQLLATVCDELGIDYDRQAPSLKGLTDALHRFLLDNHHRNRKTVLMIDEAQHLDFDVLEQIRLLTNLETNSEKLLQIILIGQPELAELLARPELRQLNQRITARYNLEPLNLAETGAYIQHRLQVAGMTADRVIFPQRVVRAIYRQTRGIPRLINLLCDRILLGAYGRNRSRADIPMLRLAAREVMGEDLHAPAVRGWLPWAALLLLLALGAGAFLLWQQGVERSPEPLATAVPTPQPEPSQVMPPSEPSQVMQPPESSQVDPQAADTVSAVSSDVAVAAPPPGVPGLLSPAEAMATLWSVHSSEPFTSDPCGDGPVAGLACVSDRALTWDQLAVLERPILLQMVTEDRFAAAAVMLAIEGRRAWLLDRQGTAVSVNLASLAPGWSGDYRYLWRPPVGFDKPLSRGDRSEVVAEVARLFARLDDQAQPLARNLFNESLEQRVKLFQRASGLEDDGVVGMQTLLKLNAALEIDPPARALLQSRAAVPVDAE